MADGDDDDDGAHGHGGQQVRLGAEQGRGGEAAAGGVKGVGEAAAGGVGGVGGGAPFDDVRVWASFRVCGVCLLARVCVLAGS